MGVERVRRPFEVVLALVWIAFAVHAVVPDDGTALSWFFDNVVYYALLIAATAGCLTRAIWVAHDRIAWLVIGAGLAMWTIGDLYYLARLQELEVVPIPSPADAFYLAYLPLMYVGVVLLTRGRLVGVTRAVWLDGITAALTVAAVVASLLLGSLEVATDGSPAAVATNLAYPIGDIVLLALLTALAAAQGFRFDRSSVLLLAGLAAATAADGAYLVQSASGTYTEGGLVDAAWAASLLLIGAAAWRDRAGGTAPAAWRPVAAMPLVCGAVATGLLILSHWRSIGAVGSLLASSAILAVLVRLAVTLRENRQLLSTANDAALEDALTGLPNRRALMGDLEEGVATARLDDPFFVVLFDLNGFKRYNDSFGHPAGDALLVRLGARLAAVAGDGEEGDGVRVYRLGGDEFCLTARAPAAPAATLVDRAVEALSEEAEGFTVTASFGGCFVPEEADSVSEALRLADVRLYSRKAEFYADHDHPHDELLRVLDARDPETAPVREHAAGLARDLAAAVGLSPTEQEHCARASLLRDVGTLALPDDLLRAGRELSPAEHRLLRRHPVIGERVLATVPALRPIAALVRSGHERWDGTGYPDCLAGSDISLPARIAALTTAYAAAAAAADPEAEGPEALIAVAREAGTRFDPDLVHRLALLVEEPSRQKRHEGPRAA